MAKLALSIVALALVAACSTREPATPAPAPVIVTPAPAPVVTAPPPTVVVQQPAAVPQPSAIRAGFGRVESITAAPQSAAAGGTQMRRLGIKMEDGTVQFVDTAAQGINMGERIELTSDGYIKK